MARKKSSAVSQPEEIIEDTGSGSMAYNRLHFQVSQVIHMAVELFDEADFLFVLDHYDDITIFDKEDAPMVVSYYQVKTNEESFTINSVISKDWLPKMYKHITDGKWPVQELGLLTNCILKITASKKEKIPFQKFVLGKTPFEQFDEQTKKKIRERIGKTLSIPESDVDLSKFVHLRTTLTLQEHRSNAEQDFNLFLLKRYPSITLETAKTIFNTLICLLSEQQSCEGVPQDASFDVVRQYKGVSKNDISRVIETALLVCIPRHDLIQSVCNYTETEKRELSLEYIKVMDDAQAKNELQKRLFERVDAFIQTNQKSDSETMLEYAKRIKTGIAPVLPIYSDLYIMVVAASIMINRWGLYK